MERSRLKFYKFNHNLINIKTKKVIYTYDENFKIFKFKANPNNSYFFNFNHKFNFFKKQTVFLNKKLLYSKKIINIFNF